MSAFFARYARLTELVAQVAAYASSAGAGMVGWIAGYAGAVLRSISDRFSDEINALDYMTTAQRAAIRARSGAIDVSAGLAAFLAAVGDNKHGVLPPGVYLFSQPLVISGIRSHIRGAGQHATQLLYRPTAHDTVAISVTAGASVSWQGSLTNLGIRSDDTLYRKTALKITDASGYFVDEVTISGTDVVSPNGQNSEIWGGGRVPVNAPLAGGSIGLHVCGREATRIGRVYVYADRPLVIGTNPNNGISCDHAHFADCYLFAYLNPVVQILSGVNLTNVTFDGYQAWVGGTYGLYWVDTTTIGVSTALTVRGVRTEQGTDLTASAIHIAHNYGLIGLTLDDITTGIDRRGAYLRKVQNVDFSRFIMSGALLALDVDSTVSRITGRGCFFQAGSTANIAGQLAAIGLPLNPTTGALPPDFAFVSAASSDTTQATAIPLSGPVVNYADSAAVVVAPGGATGTLHIATSEGICGQVVLQGAAHTTRVFDSGGGVFTNAAAGANLWHVYYDAAASSGAGAYVMMHNRGGTKRARTRLDGSATPV